MTINLLTQVQVPRQVLGQLQLSMALLFFLMCQGTRLLLRPLLHLALS
jgi:hypothetical protein